MGAYHRNDRAGISEDMDRFFDLSPRLKERVKQESGTMRGGEQQMLAIWPRPDERPARNYSLARRTLDGPGPPCWSSVSSTSSG